MEPKTENDAAVKICRMLCFESLLSLELAATRTIRFSQMIDGNRRGIIVCFLAAAFFFVSAIPVLAQQPTDAQRSAIRSACRADYEANCSSVPPGGMASLQCLQQNMSKLSGACQSAVSAIEPAAAPKAEAAPSSSVPTA